MKTITKAGLAVSAMAMVSMAQAQVDFSTMTNGITFDSAVTAVLAIGTALGAVYVAIAGARAVLRMIRG